MASQIEQLQFDPQEVPEGISNEYTTLTIGPVRVNIFTRGAINTLHWNDTDITSQRELHVMLCHFWQIDNQRGGNPYHGIAMPRYSDQLAQPGPADIHGVFAALDWILLEVNEKENSISMSLPAAVWKTAIFEYYLKAVFLAPNTEERNSLNRLIAANKKRYSDIPRIAHLLDKIESRINSGATAGIDNSIWRLVNLAYPGDLDLIRKVKVDFPFGENIPVIDDTVTMYNTNSESDAIEAGGFHTYWNLLLQEILIGPESTGVEKLYLGYDENLLDTQVRIFDQRQRLGRVVILVPEGEYRDQVNQVIYHDKGHFQAGGIELAVENNRQAGGDYPKTGRILKPGEEAQVGMRTIIIPQDGVTKSELIQIQNYVNGIQRKLGTRDLDLMRLFGMES